MRPTCRVMPTATILYTRHRFHSLLDIEIEIHISIYILHQLHYVRCTVPSWSRGPTALRGYLPSNRVGTSLPRIGVCKYI